MLTPIGWLYGKIAGLRNRLFDRGTLRSFDLGARTISIGNITAGGTGKTPLVALVAEILAESGETVCILTRGYGRADPKTRVLVSDRESVLADARTGGDEPVELARKLLGMAIVIANADRVSAAKWALEKFGVTTFLLDDGFQHRKARRDLDIVCIDATDPFGGGKMLPAGRLREPPENLKRADAVVITRANLAEDIEDLRSQISDLRSQISDLRSQIPDLRSQISNLKSQSPDLRSQIPDLRSQISDLNPNAAIFLAENRISSLTRLDEFHARSESSEHESETRKGEVSWGLLRPKINSSNLNPKVKIMAFCALGNPESFFDQLRETINADSANELGLTRTQTFPDHHFYTQQDINELEKLAKQDEINTLLTTAKDAVKLKALEFQMPCFVVVIEPVITDADEFHRLVISSR